MANTDMEELLRRVEADDPAALYDYARILEEKDPAESFKYMVFAAQLGHPLANQSVGDQYFDEENYDEAVHYYKAGAKAGLLECSVKLSAINLRYDEQKALSDLEELAEIGVISACTVLANYYRARGNKKQYAYWQSFVK